MVPVVFMDKMVVSDRSKYFNSGAFCLNARRAVAKAKSALEVPLVFRFLNTCFGSIVGADLFILTVIFWISADIVIEFVPCARGRVKVILVSLYLVQEHQNWSKWTMRVFRMKS